MPFLNEHSARIKSPFNYPKKRRQNDAFGQGIDVIWGVNQDGESELIAVRFDSKIFTPKKAKKWLIDHDLKAIEFEQAISKGAQDGGLDISKKTGITTTVDNHNHRFDINEQGDGETSTNDGHKHPISDLIVAIVDEHRHNLLIAKSEDLVLQVLYKDAGGYDLGYALDSIKPRSGDNIRIACRVKSKQDIEENSIVKVSAETVKPVQENGKWGISLNGASIIEVTKERNKPDTAKEILNKADRGQALDYEEVERAELVKCKLLKSSDQSEIDERDINKQIPINKRDAKKQIAYGVVYEPNVVDAHGDESTASEIEKSAHKFLKEFRAINHMHQTPLGKSVSVIESFIAPTTYRAGGQTITKGSWVMGVHVSDKGLWKQIEENKIDAFSMEGTGKSASLISKSESGKISKRVLKDMTIWAVALVDKGANQRTFYLKKNEEQKMQKELAIKLMKACESEDDRQEILKAVDPKEQAEVLKAVENNKPETPETDPVIKEMGDKIEALTATVSKIEQAIKKEDGEAGAGEGEAGEGDAGAGEGAGEAGGEGESGEGAGDENVGSDPADADDPADSEGGEAGGEEDPEAKEEVADENVEDELAKMMAEEMEKK